MSDSSTQQDCPNENSNAKERLKRRQERARMTQARFRNRRNQERQELLEENRQMRAAIAEIVRTTDRGDRPRLIAAVRAAADLTGVDASDITNEYCARQTGGGDARTSTTETVCKTAATSYRISSSPSQTLGNWPEWLLNQPSDRSGLSSSAITTFPSSGRLSPRLDYGIWVDAGRAMRTTKPPREIIPFIGAGRYTFAGQLYWACGDYLISLCRLVTAPYSPSPWFNDHVTCRPNPQQAEDRIWSVLRHSPPVQNVRLAQALAEAQREYRDTGFIQGDSPATNDEIGTLIRQEVEADYVARGHDLRTWMTISELERHVRRQLGGEAFSRLEKAIAPPSEAVDDGLAPDSDARAISRLLIKNLAESFICFGDGPRWRADAISTLFSQKINM